jgi:signal transduction histidine kinase
MRLMNNEPIDPRWPRLLSLAVHEFRTPITVVAGYLRMVLKERVGPISDQQRKLLEEAEKSCGRLSALVAEMSDLSALESGSAPSNPAALDLSAVLQASVAALPELPDREVSVVLEGAGSPLTMTGDATRLQGAITSLITALRREVVNSDRLIVRVSRRNPDPMCVITIAGADQIDAIQAADTSSLSRFDEWRGGSGLSLAIARRIIGQHGGAVFGTPGEEKACAVVMLPCR